MARNDWMSGLPDGRNLHQIVMPGSHDCGMFACAKGTKPASVPSAVTQFSTIREQLDLGTRFFDLRAYRQKGSSGDEIRVGHFMNKESIKGLGGIVAQAGEFGPRFNSVLNDVFDFLDANQSEFAIFKLAFADDVKEAATTMIRGHRLWTRLLDVGKRNIAGMLLRELRGKALFAFDKPMASDLYQTKFLLANKKTPGLDTHLMDLQKLTRGVLYLNGDAPTQNNLKAVLKLQNDARTKNQSKSYAPHLEMYYLTITAGTGDLIKGSMSVENNTMREFHLQGTPRTVPDPLRSTNEAWTNGAQEYTARGINAVAGTRIVNIFHYDFVNGDVNDVIIARNPP